MARYQYDGEGTREFPTLGVTVSKGDQFDGPDGLTADGLSLVSAPKKGAATIADTSADAGSVN